MIKNKIHHRRQIGHNSNPTWTRAVEDCRVMLRLATESEPLTYAQMRELLGRPMAGRDPALQRAIFLLARDEGLHFQCIRGVGYLRLSNRGASTIKHPRKVKHVRRVGARTLRESRAIPEDELSPSERVTKYAMERSLTNLVRETHGNALRPTERTTSLYEEERQRRSREIEARLKGAAP